MSQESSNHVVFPVKTVSKNSLNIIPSLKSKQAEPTVNMHRICPTSTIISRKCSSSMRPVKTDPK